MKRIVESARETQRAIAAFRRRLSELGGTPQIMEWGFPNGAREKYPTVTIPSSLGALQVGIPASWGNRLPHLLRRVKEGGPPSPDVEINIPSKLDRSVSGAYVIAPGTMWLCSRGDFTAFRGKIPRAFTFRHFEKWLVDVRDGERSTPVIPITAVDSPTLAEDLSEFVSAVSQLKENFKTQGSTPSAAASTQNWRVGSEFEGKKKPSKLDAPPEAYEYVHGPICNGLFRLLSEIVKGNTTYTVRKNANVDAALVESKAQKARIIFEVKTSTDFGSQIYSAIGQLLIYRATYGQPSTTLALVLPAQYRGSARRLAATLEGLGIYVLFGDGVAFETSDSKSLREFVSNHARA